MRLWFLILGWVLASAPDAPAQNVTVQPIDPPSFGPPADAIGAFRDAILLVSDTVTDVSLAVGCGLISQQDGNIMYDKLNANVLTLPSEFSRNWPNGQPMFTPLPASEETRAFSVLQRASADGTRESKDLKNCAALASSQGKIEKLNLLATLAGLPPPFPQ